MQKVSTGVAVAVAVILLVAGGVYFFSTRSKGRISDTAPIYENNFPPATTILAGRPSPLFAFNPYRENEYEQAIASDKLVVLYFYANWCPICKNETMDALYPAFNELTGERVIGFLVHYNDSATHERERELAREFGVAYQHTKVFLKGGKRILKSPEGWDKRRYLDEIQKAL